MMRSSSPQFWGNGLAQLLDHYVGVTSRWQHAVTVSDSIAAENRSLERPAGPALGSQGAPRTQTDGLVLPLIVRECGSRVEKSRRGS
jgi:hypothetical protein